MPYESRNLVHLLEHERQLQRCRMATELYVHMEEQMTRDERNVSEVDRERLRAQRKRMEDACKSTYARF